MDGLVYFEDLAVGAAFESDAVQVDRAEMLAYAARNDPWPFHVDEAAATSGAYGGLIASGGYTITLTYRLGHRIYNVPGRRWAVIGARQWRVKFPAPVRADDRLRLRITVQDKRPSSRPERGHFDLLYELLNQHDALVLWVLMAGLIARRPDDSLSSRAQRGIQEGP
ncbi:MAG: MaoC family dehydratase N-terminal domain-containing protein [Alphaproteobacteria bacterium]|nr:MaoC family dehydratase N-terminal domain-containing protein [Alphaproteobacteria bacterium]MCW5743956.1 MaoC family dehydratase N-terminal domain-containing protein [Alphaproteobacteria bacterium]